jgi:DNA processing protein
LSQYKCLAVVGARRHSEYGKEACRKLIAGLKGYPVIIISGLAIGIDSIAHEAALEAELLTIAVPGSGLKEDIIYPQSKRNLSRKIVEKGGCLISEYPPDREATPWTFPERNRIMAGLADAVLIIEAEQKSGTLITARIALDYNKEVLAVPGSIFSPLSEGPHFLIGQGAVPVSSSRILAESLGLEWKEGNLFSGCSEEEKELIRLIETNASRDQMAKALGKPVREISTLISLLEIKGTVKEEMGIIRLQR